MKIGDYVRTKKGISRITTIDNEQIRKIIYTDTKEVFEYYTDEQENEIKDYWKSYSSNIIDLIEVGDYVDGHEVYKVTPSTIFTRGGLNYHKEDAKIYSIVTKEQFKSIEYEVK